MVEGENHGGRAECRAKKSESCELCPEGALLVPAGRATIATRVHTRVDHIVKSLECGTLQ